MDLVMINLEQDELGLIIWIISIPRLDSIDAAVPT